MVSLHFPRTLSGFLLGEKPCVAHPLQAPIFHQDAVECVAFKNHFTWPRLKPIFITTSDNVFILIPPRYIHLRAVLLAAKLPKVSRGQGAACLH